MTRCTSEFPTILLVTNDRSMRRLSSNRGIFQPLPPISHHARSTVAARPLLLVGAD
jgi:hypothetical protein